MIQKIDKWTSENPIICGVIALLLVPFFYLIWNVGVDKANKFAGIFTPLIVALVTIYLSNRQHNIADAQRAVAEESKNIAATNRDIADKKMKLELFEKRYELYEAVHSFYFYCSQMNKTALDYFHGRKKPLELWDRFEAGDYEKFKEANKAAKEDRENLESQYKEKMTIISKALFLFDRQIYDNFEYVITHCYQIAEINNEEAIKKLESLEEDVKNYMNSLHRTYKLKSDNIIPNKDLLGDTEMTRYMKDDLPNRVSKYLKIDT